MAAKAEKRELGILDSAIAWEMREDLGRRPVFPEIVQTNLRPDILLWSPQGRKMVIREEHSQAESQLQTGSASANHC